MPGSPPDPPILTTRRLLLRPLTSDDLDALHAHWSVPEVGRWLFDDEAPSRKQTADELAKSCESFAGRGFGLWGVERTDGGPLVGACGLLPLPETGEVEILFSIQPGYWRRGYAEEASLVVLAWAFNEFGLERIVGLCDVPNEPSRRLLEKLGMSYEKREPIRGIDCFHYSLSREAHRARLAQIT